MSNKDSDFRSNARKQERKEQRRQALRKKRTILAATVTASVVIVVLAVILIVSFVLDSGLYMRDKTVFESENAVVTNAMYAFYFCEQYHSFCSSAGSRLSSIGLDTSKSLKTQESSYGEGSWFDYFSNLTQTSVERMLRCYEAALDADYEYSAADEETVAASLDTLYTSAEEAGLGIDDYLNKNFCRGLKEADVIAALKLNAVATRYYSDNENAIYPTDAELEEYYNANKNSLSYISFRSCNFSYEDEESLAAAKLVAETLSGCKTLADWDAFVKSRYSELYPTYTAEQLESLVSGLNKKDYAYENETDFDKWAFGSDRKLGDMITISNNEQKTLTVFRLDSLPYRQEFTLPSVRHILFLSGNTRTDAEAKKAADDALTKWLGGEATSDYFAELANSLSEDPGSSTNGGLYTDIARGRMVAEFNDWCFDSSRKVGDTGIVKTSYGYHVMYFEAHGEVAWKKAARTLIASDATATLEKRLESLYTVTVNARLLGNLSI